MTFKFGLVARILYLALCALLVTLSAPVAESASLPSGFSETQIASGLLSPTAMAFAPDGRLFVAQQGGRLRVIKDGVLLANPFVTLNVDANGERGLLGVAFDPDFASNHYVYVYYTVPNPLHNRVSRFTANGDVAVAGSEVAILDLEGLGATNHNGGAIHFGPVDGKLYVAVGENANGANSQLFTNRLGKILRINPDGSIPADNPFLSSTSGVNRSIWALGLRNPFTFAFDGYSGRMFINDVGQSAFEEINDGIAGSNYGWPNAEGPTSNSNYRNPLYYYGHGGGAFQGCAITGGTFYNPGVAQFPANMVGSYFFAEYCGGWINRRDPSNGAVTTFASNIIAPVDLAVGPDGRLYYLARGPSSNAGGVFRVEYAGNQAPSITQHPADRTVQAGQSAMFSVTASGTAPLSYQWQKNGAPIAGATAASYTLGSASASDNGALFRCVVTNSSGTATSNEATLTVTSPAVATITAPAANSMYSGGEMIAYAGTGTEGGADLPASAFTWQVDFHHDTHTHPFMQPTSGATSGTFTIATIGETSSNVWYRIYLTVRDSQGLTTTTYRDILPRKTNVTIATSPSGLHITLDGQPFTAPYTFTGVVGVQRSIGATSPQALGGYSYAFGSWSDGGAATHNIVTPASTTTFTATFDQGAPVAASSVWNSWDVVTQSGTPQGLVTATATGIAANLEFYESTNNGGVAKGALFSGFTAGTHPQTFNNVQQYWGPGTGTVFPYAGKSTVNRGADMGETNAQGPLGVRDLQLHPPNNPHLVVAAFRVPAAGTYAISNLGVRRVFNQGGSVSLRVFNAQQVQIATLSATADRAWVVSPTTYTLSNLSAGAYLYFAVDRGADYGWDATETSWTITADVPPPPPPSGSNSVWNSWDVVTQSGTPQGLVTATATGTTANLEFYESTNNGGVAKSALFSGFTAGTHPQTFNNVEQYWGAGTGSVYPYAGRSTVNRGADTGETNAQTPLGVRDLQLHPPNNPHLVVAAFRVPTAGTYTISNLGVRRVFNQGGSVSLRIFNAQQVEIATLSATADRAWVVSPTTYALSSLSVGDYLYFAVDRGADYGWDATEIAWTVTRTDP